MSEATPANVEKLLSLEQTIRDAPSLNELGFAICNRTRALVGHHQAALCIGDRFAAMRVVAMSDIPVVERTAPLVTWLEQAVKKLAPETGPTAISAEDLQEVENLSPPHMLLLPLRAAGKGLMGVLMVSRPDPFNAAEMETLTHLADVYGHALAAFHTPGLTNRLKQFLTQGRRKWVGAAALFALAWFPVSLTALAPAETRALQPYIVTAPIEGVVEEIVVDPNAAVAAGDVLVRLVDLDLRNQLEVARRAFRVAEAELLRSRQMAFSNTDSKARMAELQSQLEMRRAEITYADEQLGRTQITAPSAGLAIIADKRKWAGRPVQTGEKIMEVARPDQVEIEIALPVADAVTLRPGNRVDVFLDINPLTSYRAEITKLPYQSRLSHSGVLSYMVRAKLLPGETVPRIGLHGTARVYGPRTTLFYLLFRRPIMATRQMLGL